MAQIQPNTLLADRYLIVQTVSNDPACETYLAVDQSAGNAVAIRRISGLDDAYAAAIDARAKALLSAVHPVLPKVFETVRIGSDLFVVFEQIPGETLRAKLDAAGKPFPPSWVMFWADQLLDALIYIHSHRPPMIHGGLGLASIKLSSENHAVVSEYGDGIANAEKDERSDIRDLSAALYELLTCQTIPNEAARLGAIANAGADPVRRASELNPAVPVNVADVIARGISISPNERFGSASEMQKALRRAYAERQSSDATAAAAPIAVQDEVPHLNAVTSFVNSEPQGSQQGSITMDQTVVMPTAEASETNASDQAEVKTELLSPEVATAAVAAAGVSAIDTPASPHSTAVAVEPIAEQRVRPDKRKGSKAGLIVGLFFGSIILLSLIGLGGWFAYGYYKLNMANVSPTPTPTPAETPTPLPVLASSPEPSPENSPEETPTPDLAESNSNVETGIQRTTTAPQTQRTPAATPQRNPETRPTPATQRTPRPQSTPAPRQTPRNRDDRTVILQ